MVDLSLWMSVNIFLFYSFFSIEGRIIFYIVFNDDDDDLKNRCMFTIMD